MSEEREAALRLEYGIPAPAKGEHPAARQAVTLRNHVRTPPPGGLHVHTEDTLVSAADTCDAHAALVANANRLVAALARALPAPEPGSATPCPACKGTGRGLPPERRCLTCGLYGGAHRDCAEPKLVSVHEWDEIKGADVDATPSAVERAEGPWEAYQTGPEWGVRHRTNRCPLWSKAEAQAVADVLNARAREAGRGR